jgi:hypothetical protein
VTERESALRSDVADLRAAIERAAADLAIAEEPAGFAAALDEAAPAAKKDSP